MSNPEQQKQISPEENSAEMLEELLGAQEAFNERVEELLSGNLDEDRSAENLISLERQIPDITSKMRSILEALRNNE